MIRFTARVIDAFSEEFTDDFVVFSIFFEEYDPEEGGESWIFQRALGSDGTIKSLGEEDEGICVVKEIQQLTFYKGVEEVELSRNKFICKFDPKAIKETKIEGLEIDYNISDEQWAKLDRIARLVFIDRDFFRVA